MNHKVGPQGQVVPFGYVTCKSPTNIERLFQQGEFIPPAWTIIRAEGDSENDAARDTATLTRLLGIEKKVEGKP